MSHAMRHLMPIVTPRLILRPPTLDDFDTIQTAKEEAWSDLQLWMGWALDNQRSREATENSIRRVMDYQNQAGIALAGFHRINGDFVVRTALDLTDELDVYETGYWAAPKYARRGMATEAANAAIRYAFGHLGAMAINIGFFDGNESSRRIVEKPGFQKLRVAHTQRYVVLTARSSIVMNIYSPAPILYPLLTSHVTPALEGRECGACEPEMKYAAAKLLVPWRWGCFRYFSRSSQCWQHPSTWPSHQSGAAIRTPSSVPTYFICCLSTLG